MPTFNFEPIELPPEANPLTQQNLYDALVRASSSNQQQIQTAAQQLQNWEREPKFYSSLQAVFTDRSLPFEVRYLAILQIKNAVDKYWRKTATNAISKEEKAVIRSQCISAGVGEADYRLALQNAILVAKIVRYEFPHDWPDAIDNTVFALADAAQNDAGSTHLHRALLILLYVIKELSAARLQRSRVSLYNAAPRVFQTLARVYMDKYRNWMNFVKAGGNNEGKAINDVELSLLAFKVLRRLVIAGYEFPSRNSEVQDLWNITQIQFGEMLTLVRQHGHSLEPNICHLIEEHLLQTSKLHLQMIRVHPPSFPQLHNSIEVAKAYWTLLVEFGQSFGTHTAIPSRLSIGADGDEENEASSTEKLALKGLLILRACAKMVYNPALTFRYQRPEDKEERKQSTEAMKSRMLSEPMVREMMETLVTRFFVFRPRDLSNWEEEPSEWERREEGDGESWEFSIRVCAEKLFLDLVISNKELLVQPLLHVFETVATPANDNILLKDSVYSAIGLAAPILEKHLDFDPFLTNTLVPEVQIQQPGYKILRRRIAILLGQWVVVKDINRELVYRIFDHLLNKDDPTNDMVVRVTAGRQMKNVIDPWDLQIEKFSPFAQPVLARLLALVEEAELPETRIALLNTISTIIMRMEHHISPHADIVISLLPNLWMQAREEYLLKQTILGILVALITSMKDESRRFQHVIIPLIESSLDPSSDSRIFLLEETIELWSAVLMQADAHTPQLTALVKYLPPLFDTGSDILAKALGITEQYLLLAPQFMLENAPNFFEIFRSLLAGEVRREVSGVIAHIGDVFLQVSTQIDEPSNGAAVKGTISNMLRCGFLKELLLGIRSAYDAHQTTGPNRKHTNIDGVIETDYLAVLSRILVAVPDLFEQVISTCLPEENLQSSTKWILSEWFSHFENMGNAGPKKLSCLALTKLVGMNQGGGYLGYLQDLMVIWTDTVVACMEDEDVEGYGDVDGDMPPRKIGDRDCFVYEDPDGLKPVGVPEAPEDERRRNMLFADPVHRINIKFYIRDHLNAAIGYVGGPERFKAEWLVNVDSDIVSSFSRLGVL